MRADGTVLVEMCILNYTDRHYYCNTGWTAIDFTDIYLLSAFVSKDTMSCRPSLV